MQTPFDAQIAKRMKYVKMILLQNQQPGSISALSSEDIDRLDDIIRAIVTINVMYDNFERMKSYADE